MNGSVCIAQQPARALAAPSWQRRVTGVLILAFERLWMWSERARSRRMLRGLDDRMLRDIGIDRAAADHEGSRPFWQ